MQMTQMLLARRTDNTTNSTITQQLQLFEEAVQEKQNTYDTIQAKVTEKQAALDSASTALEEKQEQLESDMSADRTQRKPQSASGGCRSVRRHRPPQEINAISLEQYQKQLEKLKTIKQQNGEITAPSSGIITKVCGNRTENNGHGGNRHERRAEWTSFYDDNGQ